MGDSWHAFKTGFARTRQKVLAKVGQAEVTRSPEYEEECKKVMELQKTMERVHKNTGKYLEIMRALVSEQELIAQDIAVLAELGEPSLQIAKSMEMEREKMANAFGQYVDNPITAYMSQFKDLKDRMDDLEIRRVDMDRYFRDYNAVMAKSHPDPARVQHIETKYNVTKDGYTALFNEMMEDIPKLIADRARFFEPIVALFAKTHASFYTTTASAYEAALPSVASIDDDNIHGHKAPITSNENTARLRVRGATVAMRDYASAPHAAPSSNPTPPSSYAPPPSSYAPPPSSFAPPPSSFAPPPATFAPPPSSNPPPSAYTPPPATSFAPSAPPETVESEHSAQPISESSPVSTPTRAPVVTPTFAPTPSSPSPSPSPVYTPAPSTPTQAPAPTPAPTPVSLKKAIKAKATFDFIAQEEDELSFKKGDIINILSNEGDWWEGELNGARGNLPSNYVTVL